MAYRKGFLIAHAYKKARWKKKIVRWRKQQVKTMTELGIITP